MLLEQPAIRAVPPASWKLLESFGDSCAFDLEILLRGLAPKLYGRPFCYQTIDTIVQANVVFKESMEGSATCGAYTETKDLLGEDTVLLY